jgi:hypothetical protein
MMSNIKLIPRQHWTEYFDSVSRRFFRDDQPEVATIAVPSRLAGDRTAVHGARVIGITYDRHDDVLDVALDGVDHLVYRPTEIRVIEDADGFVRELMVKHKGGPREVIVLKRAWVPASAARSVRAASRTGVDR